jgi:hypothetical protein
MPLTPPAPLAGDLKPVETQSAAQPAPLTIEAVGSPRFDRARALVSGSCDLGRRSCNGELDAVGRGVASARGVLVR